LIEANAEAPAAVLKDIARRAAALVPDGASIQTGIGGAPAGVLDFLTEHRSLVIRSGLVTDGYQALAEAGALAPSGHITGLAFGAGSFYHFLVEADLCAFADVRTTHAARLGEIDKFTSINSALEIDLCGQANVEWRGDRLVSSVGGSQDFARAARQSRGGRSIIAMPATARGGEVSRIVAHLNCPSVSLTRQDIDTVVTEYGVAELIGLTPQERANALISIAAPSFRESLEGAWRAFALQ
jgi:acyl-CoA hydrolase